MPTKEETGEVDKPDKETEPGDTSSPPAPETQPITAAADPSVNDTSDDVLANIMQQVMADTARLVQAGYDVTKLPQDPQVLHAWCDAVESLPTQTTENSENSEIPEDETVSGNPLPKRNVGDEREDDDDVMLTDSDGNSTYAYPDIREVTDSPFIVKRAVI